MKLNPTEEAAFQAVAQRLTEAEKAIAEVREQLFALYAQAEVGVPTPVAQPVITQPVPESPKMSVPVVDKPAPRTPWWQDERRIIKYVAVGGVLVTLAGVSLLIALAIQSGWLGPLGRVIGAWTLAILLLVGAAVVRARNLSKEGRYALSTTSLLTAILTVMATVSLLEWWPPIVGAVVLLALLAVFSAIARAWDDEKMLIITVVSSFVLFWLYLISGDFFSFPIIAPALFIAVCSMQKRWFKARSIAAVLAPLAVPATLIDDQFPIAFTVILGVAIFVAISLLDEWHHPTDLRLGFYSPMIMLAIGAIFAGSFVEMTVILAVIIGYTILSVQFHGAYAVAPLTLLPLIYLLWWSHAPALGSKMLLERPILVALYFLAFSGFAWWLSRNNRFGWFPWTTVFVAGLFLTGELSSAVLMKKPLWLTGHIAIVQVAAIVAFMAVILVLRTALKEFSTTVQVLIGLASLHLSTLVIVTATTYLAGFAGNGAMWLGYLIGHALVSIFWMLLGAYILIMPTSLSQQTSLAVGLILVVAASLKLLFFDLGALEGVPRVLAFLISGFALLAIATLRARKANKASKPR